MRVQVALAERSYDIEIAAGLLPRTAEFLLQRRHVSHAVVIVDSHIAQSHGTVVRQSLEAAQIRTDWLVVPAGEQSKTISQADELWQQMIAAQADRKSVVVAVGGGVIGDLAGFVAAGFTRGIGFLQIPTTLLAQVDSSVGGKTGVNLPQAKNMVGAFWQPLGVLIDTQTLDTLPEREYRSGLAEVVKYGVILDAAFFAYLEAHVAELNARDPDVLAEIISRSCRLKADVVEQDEREETGLRAVLNYGHTFCHAIEAECGYGQWLHGEAVAIGMTCAADLAQRMGRIGPELLERQTKLLTALGLPVKVPGVSNAPLLARMQSDKKVEHGKLRFVLPSKLGQVELVGDVPAEDVAATLDACR